MANFNFYLNRQGSRGRQGVKGDKGENGYSPYIDIKSNTPTEFIMTIHNETESFDTPNLIPTAIGEKVTEMDAVLTTHTEDIANLKLDITAIKNKNNAQDSDIAALKTRVGGTEESIEDLNHKYTVLGSEVSDLTLTKQNKLVEGTNITLTDNADGTTTISASGGGGGGGGSDVPIATTQVAGKVKPDGETITVTSDGTISSVSQDVTPIATTSTTGKVKPDGTTITITDDGTISAVGGGSGTGDVTAAGNNTFTGSNTFTSTTTFNAPIAVSGGGSTIQTSLNGDTSTYIDLKVNSQADLILSTGTVVTQDADGGTYIRDGQIKDTSGNILLSQGNVTAGNNITITKKGKGIQIASSGGGLTPDENDRVTLEGINLKSHNLSNPSGSIYASSGTIEIRNQNNAGMFLDSYGGLYKINPRGIQSELIDKSMNPAYTTQVNFFNNDQIINSNYGLKFGLTHNEPMGSITASYGYMCLNPDKLSSPNAELTITSSTLTYTDRDGNTHNLLESGGSSEPPANMVTTDTDQDITGVKRFLNNRQDLSKPAIKIGSYAAGQDNYDGGYITTGMGNLEIGDYYATNSKGGFLSINSTADSSIFKITSNNSNINPRLQLGTYNYEGEIHNDIAEGLCLSNRKYDHSQRSILKIKDDTLTFKKTDDTVVDLLAGGGAAIDDSAASDTSTYSSSKIEKLTNITSSDTSITVTKSDTGVDIVANKDLVTGYAFPSNKSVSLTLGASGTKYTAPANGYFTCKLYSTTTQNSLEMYSNLVAYCVSKSTTSSALIASVPALKGQNCSIFYTNAKVSGNGYFKFVYAKGSESEAQ